MPRPKMTIEDLEKILNSEESAPHVTIGPDGLVVGASIPWPDPTPEMLDDPKFNLIWEVIRSWDINVPGAYSGYCGATGNHARAIFDALAEAR